MLDCFSDQGIVGSLVAMGNFGDDLAKGCKLPRPNDEDKANQLISNIRSKNFFSKQKPAELPFNRLEVLPIMPEWLSLTHRRLIKNGNHAFYELLIKFTAFDDDPFLFRPPNHVPRLRVDLVLPPKRVTLDRDCGDRVIVHAIVVFSLDVRQSLPKGKNVCAALTVLNRLY